MKLLKFMILTTAVAVPALTRAHVSEDPLLRSVLLDSLEWYSEDHGEGIAWDAEAWTGYNLRKLWLETEGEKARGEDTHGQVELSYGWAISPYWDAQIGWRHDFGLRPDQNWLALGLQGLAPYFVETEVSVYLDADGNSAFSLEAEKELLLTQRWVLAPEIELQAFGQNDIERDQGSGLSSVEVGLRLRYEIRRELAPYIGVAWENWLGDTAELRRRLGDHDEEVMWTVGLRAWF